MPHQFGEGFQELAEVSGSIDADYLIRTELRGFHAARRMRFIEEKYFAHQMCVWMNYDRKS